MCLCPLTNLAVWLVPKAYWWKAKDSVCKAGFEDIRSVHQSTDIHRTK